MTMGAELIVAAPLAGWVQPLGEVPDPVFAGGMMGGGIAIDPIGDTLHAPCDGVVIGIHAARHAVTLRAACGVELLLHIGIDTVAFGGEGFTPLVAAGASVVAGQPLIGFDLDLIVRRATAAVTPLLVVGGAAGIVPIASDRLVAVGEPVLRLVRHAAMGDAAERAPGAEVRREVAVGLPHGLHARPAARIAAAVRQHDAEVTLRCESRQASAASMTEMLGLAAARGAAILIVADGGDAAAAVAAIAAILSATAEADTAPAPPVAAVGVRDVPTGASIGVAAAPGLGLGTIFRLRVAAPRLPMAVGDVTAERAALAQGLVRLRATLDGGGGVMAAHRALLDDPALLASLDRAITDRQGAAAAALAVTTAQAAALAGSADPRIAERGGDLTDIGQRLAHAIIGTTPDPVRLPADTILIADDLLPSQLDALDPAMLRGIALARGGPTAHVAIMAAGIGVPMVVALGDALAGAADGDAAIVDGDRGFVQLRPDAARIDAARARIARAAQAAAAVPADRPAMTRDGRPVGVHVNLGTAAEAATALAAGAEGCGLLRTELVFLDRATPPGRQEQAETYRAVARALAGRPLTVRLLDIGGDKPAPYLALPPEENPALGRRGVRVLLANPSLLAGQLGAIVDAGDSGMLRIMVPMVASAGEVAAVRAMLQPLAGGRGIALGAMVETPAAAVTADLIAAECDFLSIGSNDLTQYALAMDRGNPAVASDVDGLHPAVLRLIAATCDGAARYGVPVGLCGTLAADPLAVPILVGLGVASLSVPAGRIAATRALLGRLHHADAVAHARAALDRPSAAAVRDLARGFAGDIA